ncbi:MAG TPA: DegT/DnrJ/EryC1/StrS family aminotransferase [Ignavibacteriaceae bacterium]|nr:DegT/DnrJ/EryC1/StrS family aminotransferase [Ignavibacteriaceae bacterium]
MKVPLLDLKPQYESLKKELDEAILKVAESQYFILGPEVDKMEIAFCDYLNCKTALGVSSGTDALLLALMGIGVGPGDEVIVPTYSFFATAGVVSRLNATPVLVDSDPVTFNMDPEKIEKKITKNTKAIIPVHLYGQSCDMDAIMEIARKHKLKVIEDAAQAIGVQYKNGKFVGTMGDIGCYSFFPSKNLGGYGDGGLVVTNDEKLGEHLHILRVHGGHPKYYHKFIGGNFRIDAIQSSVINVKLPHLDDWSAQRRENAKTYNQLFIDAGLSEETGKTKFAEKNKVLLPKAVYKESGVKNYHIFNQYIIRVEKRDELRKFLSENEIGNEIYYPVPFHLQECFADLGYMKGDFPVAEFAADTSIALPIYPELSEEQLSFVVKKIKDFFVKA